MIEKGKLWEFRGCVMRGSRLREKCEEEESRRIKQEIR